MALGIEAYSLHGNGRGFPDHFHAHYVAGIVADGRRALRCAGRSAELRAGDVMLLNPGDSHGCSPLGDAPLEYRALNISRAAMEKAAARLGLTETPRFAANVMPRAEAGELLDALHRAVMDGAQGEKQQNLFDGLLTRLLAPRPARSESEKTARETSAQVSALRRYIERHYAESLSLDGLLAMTNLSKFAMIRAFAKETGLTPYRYLQAERLEMAKVFLRGGMTPAEAADAAGFADQSHLTNYFREFTGLTPKQYQKIFSE